MDVVDITRQHRASIGHLYCANLKVYVHRKVDMMATALFNRRKARKSPLPYTASPLKLLWFDILLVLKSIWSLPGILFPLTPWNSDELDELYPSKENIMEIIVHVCLTLCQVTFLLSLLVCLFFMVPALWISMYSATFIWVNRSICRLVFNGPETILESQVPVQESPGHEHERWIFINGVAVGDHWLQSSIDRLALTFGRKVIGVHNPTDGLVFDIIECLIQRNFTFATPDTRDGYAITKETLLDPKYEKVVLILHSQGGIEGGLIIDWLLDELPREVLRKLEVYTFGNAANHFNNPYKSLLASDQPTTSELRTFNQNTTTRAEGSILHIEHYVNAMDFVCIWGVLQFASGPNRYMGKIFVRPGSGHQFNQHYLDTMFTFGPDKKVLDTNAFMEMEAKVSTREQIQPKNARHIRDEVLVTSERPSGQPRLSVVRSAVDTRNDRAALKVKDLSRLWQYRNGGSPGACLRQ
ncbi:hypothetical protein BBP40_004571 [Aspergillus hancockii]|nr:hypothetical protein BBP40_004571 [Aspergillus hancockii]